MKEEITREEAIELSRYILNNHKEANSEKREQCLTRMKYMAIDHERHLNAYVEEPIYNAEKREWVPNTEGPWIVFVDWMPLNRSVNDPRFEYPKDLTLVEIPKELQKICQWLYKRKDDSSWQITPTAITKIKAELKYPSKSGWIIKEVE